MAVLHGRRANNSSPHTYEASPGAGDERPSAPGTSIRPARKEPATSADPGYGKSTLFSCWLDLLHRDHIETNVSHASPLNPISGILVAKVSHCET